jgi:NADPH:quinone reductase-like Zn-dependent oxidoreductase
MLRTAHRASRATQTASEDGYSESEGRVMKAFMYEKYGPPETLRMAEVEKPVPEADEALVKVLAASVNAADWHIVRGKLLFSRATLGLLRPKHKILGVDIAGEVEAVGSGVTQFKPGDEVYANLLDHGYGGFAEYVSVPEAAVSLKPANLSLEEAAAVPMAAVTALQALRHHGEIQPGQKVLINGASGGVGTFAVQIAKSYGAEVTGASSFARSAAITSSTTRQPTSLREGSGTTSSTMRLGTDQCGTSDGRLPRAARPPSRGSAVWQR